MERKLVFSKDLANKDIEKLLELIKESNEQFYSCLMDCLKKDSSVVIDKEVLDYFSVNANKFGDNNKFLKYVVDLACNSKTTVHHVNFIVDYFHDIPDDSRICDDDFFIVLSACVEKGLPISEIKNLFYSNNDAVYILETVDSFMSSDIDTSVSASENSDIHVDNKENAGLLANIDKGSSVGVPVSSGTPSSDVDMINNILTVLTFQDENEMDIINGIQTSFMNFNDRLQSFTSDLSVFSTDVINHLKKNEEDLRRLRAMISINQKLLSSKQREINELRMENERLNNKINDFQLSGMKQDALKEKINELSKLASNFELSEGFNSSIY